RRELLQAGGLASLGLFLPNLLRVGAEGSERSRSTISRARSVILLYLHGGHAQQETWDPKPRPPEPARGDIPATATRLPGVHVREWLPVSARIMHKLAVSRWLGHGTANHVQASLAAMTGHSHPPEAESRGDFPPSPADFPPFGAVLSSLRPPDRLPTWVQV